MNPTKDQETPEAQGQRASRAQLIIYIAMFIGMALPFFLAWWMGAFSF